MPAGNAPIQIVGTIGGDPELRDVGGTQVASFSVAVGARKKVGDEWVDGDTTWWRCSAWREVGQNAAASLHKGDQVIVLGTVGERKYTNGQGEEKSSWEVDVEHIGPSLRFATAQVTRTQRGTGAPRTQGDAGGGRRAARQEPQVAQAWAGTGSYDDNTPF